MTKKQIKKLALQSYTKGELSEEKTVNITKLLKRADLKKYIRELKTIEQKTSVEVTLPFAPSDAERGKIKSLFPDKKITYISDPTLVAGFKIVDDDTITDINIKNTLEEIISHITDDYD